MTNPVLDQFSAVPTGRGFFYQYRYALLLLLEGMLRDPAIEIAIERADDVTVGARGKIASAVQTKNHQPNAKRLTDSSKDLWGTLRVWCEGVGCGEFDLNVVKLLLVTTAEASKNGLARLLRPGDGRDPGAALARLLGIARKSRAEGNAESYRVFLALEPTVRRAMVHVIQVLDRAPTADDLDERITRAVGFAASPSHTPLLVQALQGRWLRRVDEHLAASREDVITGYEVHDWLRELRAHYRSESLPTNLEFAEPPESLWLAAEEYTFVRQLRHMGLSDELIAFAVRDFYQAFEQRGQWVREKLLHLNEAERYNLRLLDAWGREFAAAAQRLARAGSRTPEAKLDAAVELYEVLQRADHRIRPECSAPFVMRGSFQMLADEPKLGWHPDWEQHFGAGSERRRAG